MSGTIATILTLLMMHLLPMTSGFPTAEGENANSTARPDDGAPRIVGGRDIAGDEYIPYQVSLQYRSKSGDYQHFCGGSIISANRILTAAHCCKTLDPRRMSVLAGVRDLNDIAGGQRAQVISYEIHENYEALVTSDIAVLRIEPALQLDGVRTGAIPVNGTEMVGGNVPVTLTGWGLRLPAPLPFLPAQFDTINYPTTLQTMTYNTISNRECVWLGMTDVTETEICAMGYFFKAACSGDSGGPLVMSTGAGLQQVGVVSYGLFVCGVFEVPDVYTRVSVFRQWIENRMK